MSMPRTGFAAGEKLAATDTFISAAPLEDHHPRLDEDSQRADTDGCRRVSAAGVFGRIAAACRHFPGGVPPARWVVAARVGHRRTRQWRNIEICWSRTLDMARARREKRPDNEHREVDQRTPVMPPPGSSNSPAEVMNMRLWTRKAREDVSELASAPAAAGIATGGVPGRPRGSLKQPADAPVNIADRRSAP